MGRRHRDMQQERRRARGATPPARRNAVRRTPPRGAGGGALSRYLVDLAGILVIALAVNLLLRELGMVNAIVRIILALVAGRVIVTLVRRAIDARG